MESRTPCQKSLLPPLSEITSVAIDRSRVKMVDVGGAARLVTRIRL